MADGNLNKNQEAEIFTIPEEFYGAQHKTTAVRPSVEGSNTAVTTAKPVKFAENEPRRFKPGAVSVGSVLSSPKFVITAVAVILVVVVGGFSYYYVHQAQIAREKLAEAQKPKENQSNQQPVVPAVVIPAPVVEEPMEVATTTEPTIIQPTNYAIFPFKNYSKSEDVDNDGLTNTEEALYGTAVDKPDTDEDGFSDATEVENLYNPLGFKPVKLIDSGKVKAYFNPTYNYSIFYPVIWVAQSLDANNEQVIFSSDTGEFVEVTIEDNPLKLAVADWYLGQSPGVSADELKTITTKEGFKGVMSPDGLAVYLPFEDRIFVIYYNIGLKTEVNFYTTFKMMTNSFKAGVAAPAIGTQLFASSTVSVTSTSATSTGF